MSHVIGARLFELLSSIAANGLGFPVAYCDQSLKSLSTKHAAVGLQFGESIWRDRAENYQCRGRAYEPVCQAPIQHGMPLPSG